MQFFSSLQSLCACCSLFRVLPIRQARIDYVQVETSYYTTDVQTLKLAKIFKKFSSF